MAGWNKELVASLERVKCSHYAEDDKFSFALNIQRWIA